MFITFEGLDFAGKTTQIELLKARLGEAGKNVRVVREPGGTAIGEKIREILLDKQHLQMSHLAELFLFSASRSQIVQEIVRPTLEAKGVVICDRFFDSTTAYQGFGRQLPLDAVKIINTTATGGLEPDLTFFLDIPIEEMLKRAEGRENRDRMESNNIEFYKRVREGYCALAHSELRFHRIDGMLPKEKVHARIWGYIVQSGLL